MKRFLAVILALLLFSDTAGAQTAVEYVSQRCSQKNFDHDYFLEYVLFGRKWTSSQDESYSDESKKLSSLAMIEYACLLCIDQFNKNDEDIHTSDQRKLDRLRKQVSGLPRSIDELNPDKGSDKQLSGTNHRTYTHRGWKYNYNGPDKPGNIAHSEKREAILRKTVAKVFQFKAVDDVITTAYTNLSYAESDRDRCECYCRLFYYLHLLGDCYEDENFNQANGKNNGQKMPLGRKNPSKKYIDDVEASDIITEITWVCVGLFSESPANSENFPHLKKN